jgi:hydroxymethylglutaryl-CoA reductase (NADPH)
MKLKHIGSYDLAMNDAQGRNIEKMVGCVQVPLGIVSDLKVNGKNYKVPIATTEGALVASISRGSKVIRESGGCEVKVKEAGTTRGPVFKVSGLREGEKLIAWVYKNFKKIKQIAEASDKYLKLLKIRSQMVGRYVWLRLEYTTCEAMGMNMVTIASEKVVELLEQKLKIKCVSLSGNYCVDKKPSWLNMIEGRGKQVWAEVKVPEEVVRKVLKISSEEIVEVVKAKQWLGSMVSGSMGFNAHYANMVAGVFLATGQDMAHVVEGSMGITTAEVDKSDLLINHSLSATDSSVFPAKTDYLHTRRNFPRGSEEPSKLHLRKLAEKKISSKSDLYFSVYLPSLMVGTVGGGTGLATQKEALGIMGLKNKKGDVVKLAEVIGGVVLAGELSLTAALASSDLAKAHQRLGRGEG